MNKTEKSHGKIIEGLKATWVYPTQGTRELWQDRAEFGRKETLVVR